MYLFYFVVYGVKSVDKNLNCDKFKLCFSKLLNTKINIDTNPKSELIGKNNRCHS